MDPVTQFDPTTELAAVTLLTLLITWGRRLRRETISKTLLLSACFLLVTTCTLGFCRAYLAFEQVQPRTLFADYWDSLLFLQALFIAIAGYSIVTAISTVLGSTLQTRSPAWRLALALPIHLALLSSWLLLSNAAPLLDEYFVAWMTALLLAFSLVACSTSLTQAARGGQDVHTISPTIFVIATVAFLLLALRLSLLVPMGLGNADIAVYVTLMLFVYSSWSSTAIWLAQKVPSRLVLFLRRFGNTTLNATISGAVKRWTRPRSVLVSLDDRDIAPSGASPRPVLITAGTALAALLPIVAALSYVVSEFETFYGIAEQQPSGVAHLIVLVATTIAIAFAALPIGVIALWSLWRSVNTSRYVVQSTDDIASLTSIYSSWPSGWQRAHSLRRARSTVVTTSHNQWQPTVLALLAIADLVVIDISDVTPAIQWELDRIRELAAHKTIVLTPIQPPPDAAIGHRRHLVLPPIEYSSTAHLARLLRAVGVSTDSVEPDSRKVGRP